MKNPTPLNHWCCEATHPDLAFGNAGSLVLRCPHCDADHFRNPAQYLHTDQLDYCVHCRTELLPVPKGQTLCRCGEPVRKPAREALATEGGE